MITMMINVYGDHPDLDDHRDHDQQDGDDHHDYRHDHDSS